MREEMMPDILPSLFCFEVEVHRVFERVQKNPPKGFMLTEDRKRLFYEKSTTQYHTMRWEYDAKMPVDL